MINRLIYTPYTENYAKVYPDHSLIFKYKTPKQATIQHKAKPQSGWTGVASLDSFERSVRRSKTTIADIILCNKFKYFVTFTFNCRSCGQGCKNAPCICDENCHRFSPEKSKKKMSSWLHSTQKKYGKFQYIIVPEFHKDGKSIHFHALLSDYRGKLTYHKTHKGRKVFNVDSYKNGYTTLVEIDDHKKVSSYVKKYITKDMPKFENSKKYWCSMGLNRPHIVRNSPLINAPFINSHMIYENEMFEIYYTDVTIPRQVTRIEELWHQLQASKTILKQQELLTSNLSTMREEPLNIDDSLSFSNLAEKTYH